jgi:hypothetical protein
VDVALGQAPSASLAEHLRRCVTCRERLAAESRRAAALDDDLRMALAVEPSPWLVARARRSATEAGLRRHGWPAAPFAARAAAAMLPVLAAALWIRMHPASPGLEPGDAMSASLPAQGSPAPAASPAPAGVPSPATPPASTGAVRSAGPTAASPAHLRAKPTSRGAVSRRTAAVGPEPEVLVAPEEAAALARYLSAARQRRIARASTSQAAAPMMIADLAFDDLDVPALKIDPLGGS